MKYCDIKPVAANKKYIFSFWTKATKWFLQKILAIEISKSKVTMNKPQTILFRFLYLRRKQIEMYNNYTKEKNAKYFLFTFLTVS